MFVEQRSLKLSLALHIALLLVAAFGLPVLLPDVPEPQPLVMTVDILPISEMTNVRPSDKPIQKAQATDKPQPEPKEPPKPKEVEKKDEPEDEPFDPMEEAEPVEKKKEEKKEKQDEFEELLKDLKETADKVPEKGKDKTAQEENKTVSDAPYDESMPLSLSEEDALRSAYIPCWSPPSGAMEAASLITIVRAQYNPDGSLIDVKLEEGQQGRYNSDGYFRAAADAALRAVRHPRCNPLKNLPATIYPKLKDTKITFDPRLMLM